MADIACRNSPSLYLPSSTPLLPLPSRDSSLKEGELHNTSLSIQSFLCLQPPLCKQLISCRPRQKRIDPKSGIVLPCDRHVATFHYRPNAFQSLKFCTAEQNKESNNSSLPPVGIIEYDSFNKKEAIGQPYVHLNYLYSAVWYFSNELPWNTFLSINL